LTKYLIDWFLAFNATFSNFLAMSWRPVLVMQEAGLPGEREPPTMGKQLVNCITCGCESSAPFKKIPYQLWYIMYKMNMLFPPSVFSRVRVARSLVLHVCFVDRCLSFCPFSVGLCVVCSSSINGFWLPLWYLQTLLAVNYDSFNFI
jgi:hypothetical protein